MTGETKITRATDWLTAGMGNDLVMMNAASGVYLNLTGAGGPIWKLLERPMRIAELCATLQTEYQAAPETIFEDVSVFLERLRAHRAVQLDHSTAS